MVPEGGAGVQAGVAQLHALDLQVAVTDARVLAVHHQHVVFGPVDSLGGVAGGAAQVKRFAGVEREHFQRSFHSHCQDRERRLVWSLKLSDSSLLRSSAASVKNCCWGADKCEPHQTAALFGKWRSRVSSHVEKEI